MDTQEWFTPVLVLMQGNTVFPSRLISAMDNKVLIFIFQYKAEAKEKRFDFMIIYIFLRVNILFVKSICKSHNCSIYCI